MLSSAYFLPKDKTTEKERDSTKSCGLALTRHVVELLLKCVFSFKLVLLVSYIICGFSSPDSFGYPDILLCVHLPHTYSYNIL